MNIPRLFDLGIGDVRIRYVPGKEGGTGAYHVWLRPADEKLPPVIGIMGGLEAAVRVASERAEVLAGLVEKGLDPRLYSLDTGNLLEPDDGSDIDDMLS